MHPHLPLPNGQDMLVFVYELHADDSTKVTMDRRFVLVDSKPPSSEPSDFGIFNFCELLAKAAPITVAAEPLAEFSFK